MYSLNELENTNIFSGIEDDDSTQLSGLFDDDEDEDEDEDEELELESLFLRFFFDPFRSRFRRRFLSSESLSDDDESRPDDSPLDDEDTFEDISRSRFATSGSNRLSALSRASRLSPSSSIEPPLPSVLLER